MTTSPNVLALPPLPPSPINTVALASAGLALSAASVVVHYSISFFPSNAPVESIFAFLSAFMLFVLGFILGINAIFNETKRTQFEHVVTRYTSITGDKRYLPYILPVRAKIVTPLFVITIALPIVAYLISLIGGPVG